MDIHTAHAIASQIFASFNLSYVFTSRLIQRGEAPQQHHSNNSNKSSSTADAILSPHELGRAGTNAATASFSSSFIPTPAAATSCSSNNSTSTNGNTVYNWEPIPEALSHLICFSFSKPTLADPRPAVVVDLFVEILGWDAATNTWRFLLRCEGQRFSRLLIVRGNGMDKEAEAENENAFSEKWIDKVFAQKEAVLGRKLWLK